MIDQPYKMGWRGDDLYIEIHTPLEGEGSAGTLQPDQRHAVAGLGHAGPHRRDRLGEGGAGVRASLRRARARHAEADQRRSRSSRALRVSIAFERAATARLRARILRPRSSIYRVSPWLRLWGPPSACEASSICCASSLAEKRRGAFRHCLRARPLLGRNRRSLTKKTPRISPRRLRIERMSESNYFDCDFLNMRSIFSLLASQHAWLA